MPQPLGRVEAQVDAGDRQRHAAGHPDLRHGIPAAAPADGHRQRDMPDGEEVDPERGEDGRAPAAAGAGRPVQAAPGGEQRDAGDGEQPPGHLLEAEDVGVDGSDDPGRGRRVVEEVAGVVGRHPQGGPAGGRGHVAATSSRARVAAPMRPASLPSSAWTIRASGR